MKKLIFIFFFLYKNVFAYNFSQEIFEKQNNIKCLDANKEENDLLISCTQFAQKSNFDNFDKTSEFIVFNSIAKMELPRLKCQLDQMQYLFNNKEVFNNAIIQSCQILPNIFNLKNEQKKISEEIESQSNILNRDVRRHSPEDLKRIHAKIDDLNAQLSNVNSALYGLKNTDTLLSSNQIYNSIIEKFSGSLFQSAPSLQKVCEELPAIAKSGLKTDLENLNNSYQLLSKQFKNSEEIILDKDTKIALWNSYSKNDFLNAIKNNPNLLKSTYCRMEGRYGTESKKNSDVVKNLGIAALSVIPMLFLPETGLIASVINFKSPMLAERWFSISRAFIGFDLVTAAGLDLKNIHENCKDKITVASANNQCDSSDPKQMQNFYNKTLEVQQCLKSVALTLISQGLTAASIRNENIKSKIGNYTSEKLAKNSKNSSLVYEEILLNHKKEVEHLEKDFNMKLSEFPGNNNTFLNKEYIKGNVKMKAKSEIETSELGKMYKIEKLPNVQNSTKKDIAITHPEIATTIEKLEKMGYKTLIDTSLNNAPLKSIRSDSPKYIAINSQTTWNELKEQYKSVQFKYYIENEINKNLDLVSIRYLDKSLIEVLPTKIVQKYGIEKIKEIEKLITKNQLTLDGVEKTLQSREKIKKMGVIQYSLGLNEYEKNKNILDQMIDLKSRLNETQYEQMHGFAKNELIKTSNQFDLNLKKQKIISQGNLIASGISRNENYQQILSIPSENEGEKETPILGQLENGEWVVFGERKN